MKLGTIVQNSSNPCDSYINWSILVLNNVDIILYLTIVTIKIIIVNAWSWKNKSCSINGDAAFWKPRDAHVGILKRV